jgi:hypothetical protein
LEDVFYVAPGNDAGSHIDRQKKWVSSWHAGMPRLS